MRVMVANKYTYETDLPVEVGTLVRLPGRSPGSTFDAQVTALESTYDGECKTILGIVKEYPAHIVEMADNQTRVVIYDGDVPIYDAAIGKDEAKKWLKERDPFGKLVWMS